MNIDDLRFLSLPSFPGKVDAEQAALILGFDVEDITILMNHGLLVPLGDPAINGKKYFLAIKIDLLRKDEQWYHQATNCIYRNTREKNRLKELRKEERKAELRGQTFSKNAQNSGG